MDCAHAISSKSSAEVRQHNLIYGNCCSSGLQLPVFRSMSIIDPAHKTEKLRDCPGYGQCGGRRLLQQGRRASLAATVILIILIHPLIPAPRLHPRRYSVDYRCSISPQTCLTPTFSNRLLSSTPPHHRIMRIIPFLRRWGSQILEFRTQHFHLQICQTHNLILTYRSCSGTEVFRNLVGVWWLERLRLFSICFSCYLDLRYVFWRSRMIPL